MIVPTPYSASLAALRRSSVPAARKRRIRKSGEPRFKATRRERGEKTVRIPTGATNGLEHAREDGGRSLPHERPDPRVLAQALQPIDRRGSGARLFGLLLCRRLPHQPLVDIQAHRVVDVLHRRRELGRRQPATERASEGGRETDGFLARPLRRRARGLSAAHARRPMGVRGWMCKISGTRLDEAAMRDSATTCGRAQPRGDAHGGGGGQR
jgi:hypothetical protein